jgi:hypothetical protein
MVSPCAASRKTEGKNRIVGPPWAPKASPSQNEIAKRTPMDEYLEKMGGSDSRNDFAAATYAMIMASKMRK